MSTAPCPGPGVHMRYWGYMQKHSLRFCSSFLTCPGSRKRTHLKIPVLWVELGSPNRHVEVLTPRTCERGLHYGLYRGNHVRMRSSWLRVGLRSNDSMTGLNKESDLEVPRHTQRKEEHVMAEAEVGLKWTKGSQGLLAAAGSRQTQGRMVP